MERGSIELVQLLLDAGADVNVIPIERRSVLQTQIEMGNLKLAQLLMNAGADINALPICYSVDDCDSVCGGHRTALQAAAESGNIRLVMLLLGAGANVKATAASTFGISTMRAAVATDIIELVQLLLRVSPDVNAPPTCACEDYELKKMHWAPDSAPGCDQKGQRRDDSGSARLGS